MPTGLGSRPTFSCSHPSGEIDASSGLPSRGRLHPRAFRRDPFSMGVLRPCARGENKAEARTGPARLSAERGHVILPGSPVRRGRAAGAGGITSVPRCRYPWLSSDESEAVEPPPEKRRQPLRLLGRRFAHPGRLARERLDPHLDAAVLALVPPDALDVPVDEQDG